MDSLTTELLVAPLLSPEITSPAEEMAVTESKITYTHVYLIGWFFPIGKRVDTKVSDTKPKEVGHFTIKLRHCHTITLPSCRTVTPASDRGMTM